MSLRFDSTSRVYETPTSLSRITSLITLHETTKRDQFLMKLRSNFEGIRSNLMNKGPIPSLDTCLNELLREEQRLLTQASMEQQNYVSF